MTDMNRTLIKPNLDEYERLFLSLGDKTRLKLLALMANEPVSVGYLVDELGESQPKVSRHLAYLRNSGVVSTERDGKWIYYGIQESIDPDIGSVINFVLNTLTEATVDKSKIIEKSRSRKSVTTNSVYVEMKEVESEVAAIKETVEPLIDSDSEFNYESYNEDEAEEIFIESPEDKDEIEVFLL